MSLTPSTRRAPTPSTVTVTGPDGQTWQDGDARIAGESVVQPLRALTQPSSYRADWRVVAQPTASTDGAATGPDPVVIVAVLAGAAVSVLGGAVLVLRRTRSAWPRARRGGRLRQADCGSSPPPSGRR